MRNRRLSRCGWTALCLFGLGSAVGLTGCQVDVGGQTLPSPYYQEDDIQYFPHGPEAPLPLEAAAQKAFAADQARAAAER